jgi:transcriptional regulator with XRE-family HTH domain
MFSDYDSAESNRMRQDDIRFLQNLGMQIRFQRNLKGLTQEQLGERAGVSHKYVGEIERGTKKASVVVLVRIAQVLKVPLNDLVGAPVEKGDAHLSYKLSILRLLENRDLSSLKKLLNLVRAYFGET